MLLLTAACNSAPDLESPPEIRYGEDTCTRCLMIINEARFAASYVIGTGEVRHFDDLGEMFSYLHQYPENVVIYWVHDYDTGEWLKGRDAFYVAGTGFRTPMGFNIVAVSTEERAESLAAETDSVVHSFESLIALAAAGEIELAHEPPEP
jgi:copper chaperone NosL